MLQKFFGFFIPKKYNKICWSPNLENCLHMCMQNNIGGGGVVFLSTICNLKQFTYVWMSRQVRQYRFDFHSNNLKISIGNDLKHVANVSGRRGWYICHC